MGVLGIDDRADNRSAFDGLGRVGLVQGGAGNHAAVNVLIRAALDVRIRDRAAADILHTATVDGGVHDRAAADGLRAAAVDCGVYRLR